MARPLPSPPFAATVGLALLDHRAGFLVVRGDAQDVAGLRDLRKTEDDDGAGRTRLLDALAAVVLERAHATERLADDDDVADLEGARLDQGRGDRAAALVHLRLDDRADGGAIGVGLELLEVRHEQDHLDELVEALAALGRDRHERHVAAVLLDDDAGLGQLGLDADGVRVGLVDLVERDDDRDLGRLRVGDRLERLGHDAVVRRDHDDRDVGDAGAAGAHRGEGLVTGGIEEDDALAVVVDLARADVLGDAATFAGRDLGRAQGVEEARLAVVDVAHHGDDRGARLEVRGVVLVEEGLLGGLGRGAFGLAVRSGAVRRRGDRLGHLVAELGRDEGRRVAVDQLVDRREDPALDQLADDVRDVDRQQLRELLDGDGSGQLDRAALARIDRLDLRRESAVATRRLAGAASAAGAAPTPGHGLLLVWCSW